MNLAALWQLPVLFCCENNLYAMGTALDRAQAQTDLALRAASYGMPAWPVDGMDVLAVEHAARTAAEAVRAGGGPHFLELRTYRFRAHSMYDPELYRDKAEVEQWRQRDPIELLTRRMRDAGELSDDELAAIEDDARRPRSTRRSLRRGRHRPSRSRTSPGSSTARSHHERRRPGQDHLPRGAARRDPRGDAARRPGLPDGRGRRPVRRLLRGQPGPARGVRPGADQGHPAVGVGVRRRGDRRGAWPGCGRSSRS